MRDHEFMNRGFLVTGNAKALRGEVDGSAAKVGVKCRMTASDRMRRTGLLSYGQSNGFPTHGLQRPKGRPAASAHLRLR